MTDHLLLSSGNKIIYQIFKNADHNKLAILVHGTCANRNSYFFPYFFPMQDFNILTFDLEGNGDSEGEFLIGGFLREVENIKEVVNHSRDLGYDVVALIGHSKGGNSILLYGSMFDDVPVLVPIAARFDMSLLPKILFPVLDEVELKGFSYFNTRTKLFKIDLEGITERRNLNMKEVVLKVKSQVIVVYGGNDDVTPESDAHEIFGLLGSRCFKEVMIEEANHMFCGKENELMNEVRLALLECLSLVNS